MSGRKLVFLGEDATLHHVGLACSSIDEVLGANVKIHDPIQKVHVAFADMHGLPVELIEPATPDSPVSASLAKGQKLVHACYEVDDIRKSIETAKKNGFHLLSQPVPATAFENRPIAWLVHKVFGLIELVQRAA